MEFTNSDYADIIFIYGFCNGNARQAREEYHLRFPQRRIPSEGVFSRTFDRLKQTGSVAHQKYLTGRPNTIPNNIEEEVLQMVEEDPTLSTRRIATRKGISQSKTWRILKTNGLHPYHLTPVQFLQDRDKPSRLDFCVWLKNMEDHSPGYIKKILWTDEATFTRDGITNFHNLHEWSHENPHKKREGKFQERFKVNVWAGILHKNLIGPFILPDNLNANNYLEFLVNELPNLLEDVPLNQLAAAMYQQDGAPAHSARIVTNFLNGEFQNGWIGRCGPYKWPPRSPDLTPLDFFFGVILKT